MRPMRSAMFLLTAIVASPATSGLASEFVTIGDAGNPDDIISGSATIGQVNYDFRISTTEVTNQQYADFLNSVASSDPNGLFNILMQVTEFGGIQRLGQDGAYAYLPKIGHADRPVTFVSYLDAMRFTNWMHNGMGDGDTETGAYTIGDGASEVRSSNARFFIPSADEWYKAAYYQPIDQGGNPNNEGYWPSPEPYPAPEIPGVNANTDSILGGTTPVATFAANYYGLHDTVGNVWEWTEELRRSQGSPDFRRVFRGGAWNSASNGTVASLPDDESANVGFRIAAAVPAPASAFCVTFSGASLALRRRR